MKIAILVADSNGGYPVPAVNGGAVPTLIEHLVKENNKKQLVDMTIISLYDPEAEKKAIQYPHIHFIWIKSPRIIKVADSLIYLAVKLIFKNKKNISFISIGTLLYYIATLSKMLKKCNYDKLIIENNIPMAWIIKLSKYKGDYYYHLHNVPRINARCKDIFTNTRRILCVSNYVSRRIQSTYSPIGPINSENIRTFYNCVDTSLFRKIEDRCILDNERKKFKIKEDDKVVVFVGRLSEEKGIDKLLEAVAKLKTKNIKVLIVGCYIYNRNAIGEYQYRLYKLANTLQDKICFTGYIAQKELPLIYNIANIAVLPSMWEEPAGLTMVEAMACGTAVITTESGGIPEYVANNAVVLKRDCNLVKNIAASIDQIMNESENKIIERSKSGIKRVQKLFSTDTYLERFVEELYQ